MELKDPIIKIKGIAEKKALLFSKASVFCVNDLLHYFPRDYKHIPTIKKICDTRNGENCCIQGKICSIPRMFSRYGKSILSFDVRDESTMLTVTYFNMPYLKKEIVIGKELILNGKMTFSGSKFTMVQPSKMTIDEYRDKAGTLIPVYKEIKGFKSNEISKFVRSIIGITTEIKEYLPEYIIQKYNLLPIGDALRYIHFPKSIEQADLCRKRLAFDELFAFMIKMNALKAGVFKPKSSVVVEDSDVVDDFISKLPYQLTEGQLKAVADIKSDIMSGHVMNRLIEGDVGCGKTIVAFAAALMVINSGYQAVIMAPTGVLASQHYEEIMRMTEEYNLPFKPCYLAGSLTAKEKRLVKAGIKDGQYNIIIGTHAILEDDVEFSNLGLAITDEQHRFGVKQRYVLGDKGNDTHVVVMSATPIPRTLALILYGDLDITLIKDKPAMRKPIKNAVVGDDYHAKILDFINARFHEGRQSYIICAMAEGSDDDDGEIKNVVDYSKQLQNELGNDIKVRFLHGKLKNSEKESIMESFKNKEFDVLVSTTVVEVGINVPNSTTMIVENAERFGLAQLHQLRGRVGRGDEQSYCIFVCHNDSKKAIERLNILKNENDGFIISEKDLKLRGPGDFWGYRQSGDPMFMIADIYDDAYELKLAKSIYDELDAKGENLISLVNEKSKDKDNISIIDFHGICL